jgi:glycosyltransferase involved in cell wall biosynthesis
MEAKNLRVALFSGNYNYVRDGANQSLNLLVGHLLKQGVAVRIYSPTTDTPDFPPTGDLVSVPSRPVPGGRSEYRFATHLPASIKRDLEAFAPNLIHLSAPEFLGHGALRYARNHGIPAIASVHTRFETYMRYYGLAFLEPILVAIFRRFYRRCDAIVAPSESFAQVLREQRMNYDISIWSRGINRELWYPERRDMAWRRSLGIADDAFVIGYLGRLVMEKGLDVFAEAVARLERRGVPHHVLVVGEGPARGWFESRRPKANFTGFLSGDDLARGVASMDVLFNPSVTEAFGNVTLEALACGVPVVAAIATGSMSLIDDGVTGRLIRPGAIESFADAIQQLIENPDLRTRMGEAAIREAQNYSWDSINQSLLDTYLRIVRQRQSTAQGSAPVKS